MRSKLRRLVIKARSHSRAEWRLFGQAILGLTAARTALSILPLPLARRAIRRLFSTQSALPPGRRSSVEQVIWAVVAAARRSPTGSTCLPTALVAQALLGLHGYE